MFIRQIQQESQFNVKAVSPKNAQGIAQIIPSTAKSWGVNPWEPVQALKASARHTASNIQTIKKAGYTEDEAYIRSLAIYNAGICHVNDYTKGTNKCGQNPLHRITYLGVPNFKETKDYIRIIMRT